MGLFAILTTAKGSWCGPPGRWDRSCVEFACSHWACVIPTRPLQMHVTLTGDSKLAINVDVRGGLKTRLGYTPPFFFSLFLLMIAPFDPRLNKLLCR